MRLDKLLNICYTVFSTSHKTDVQQDTGLRLVSACMPVSQAKKEGYILIGTIRSRFDILIARTATNARN